MIPKRSSLAGVLAAVAVSLPCNAQYVAPASIAPSLIQYTAPFPAEPGVSATRLILYNADGTYVEISSDVTTAPGGNTTYPTQSGTYTYSIDRQNPSHAMIAYGGSTDPRTYDNLYFTAPTGGTQVVPNQASAGGDGLPWFRYSPKETTNGGANVSIRCQLDSGAVAICGFVVQSATPRWVLIRAAGATLTKFGVSSVVSSPSFTLYDSTQTSGGTSSVWSFDPNLTSGYSTIFSLAGAFPLISGSDEGVLLAQLSPGAYTSVFKSASAGTILCEVYILPF